MGAFSAVFLFLTVVSQSVCWAGWGFDLSGSAQMGHFSSETMTDNSIYFYELAPGYAFKGSAAFHVSLSVAGITGNDLSEGVSNAYAATLTGLRVGVNPPKWKWLGIAASFYPSATSSETLTSATNVRSGSAFSMEAGAYLKVGGNWKVALKLGYYSLGMTSLNTGSTTTSESYSRTFVFPTATLRWGF